MTERGLKNINVFYSTFTNVFFIFVTFFTLFNVFYFFSGTFFYIYGVNVIHEILSMQCLQFQQPIKKIT